MKKFLTIAALAASLAAGLAITAAPASAGPTAVVHIGYGHHSRGGWDHDRRDGYDRHERGFETRISELDQRIDDGRRSGRISYREARHLNDKLDDIRHDKRRYERSGHGISREESSRLDSSLDSLSRSIRWEKRDRNRW